MLRRLVLALAVVVGTWTVGGVRGQVDPAGGATPGGFQIDPAMLEQIQQMQQMGQQVMQNMQNSGVDPQQFFQEQIQSGNFDPQAMQQSLVEKGIMTQDQVTQINGMMNQLQQSFQDMNPGNFGATRTNFALNSIRQQLNVTDDEWNVLLPRIQRVLTVMADVQQNNNGAMSTGMMPNTAINGFGGPNGMGGGAGPGGAADPQAAPETPIARAWRELCETVQDPQAPETELSSKLATWRTLHEAARSDLEASRIDLTQILTLRQEAVLLRLGIL